MKSKKSNLLIPLSYLFLTFLLANKMYSFPASLRSLKIFETDGIFTQAQIQSFVDGAIFGSTSNLGYPLGYSHWLSPQFSFLEGILIWIIGNSTSITNYGLISIIGLITLICNLISMHYLGYCLTRDKYIAFTFGIIGLTTPFALNSLMHPHVMKIFILPVILIYLIKMINNEKLTLMNYFIIVITILGSSLFWLNVLLAIFIVLIIVQLIDFLVNKVNKKLFVYYLKIFMFISGGFIFNSLLYFYNSELMGDRDRLAWQSDLFSGKFTDVLLGSPFLNNYIGRLNDIIPGSSPETWAMMLGLPLMIGFTFAIYAIISAFQGPGDTNLNMSLKQISIVSILFFILGGLSNLQASFFVLLGFASPMRTWSRLSVLVAILGLCVFYSIYSKSLKTHFIRLFSTILILLSLIEIIAIDKLFDAKNNLIEHESYQALRFLESNYQPCPVLQLPIDTYLLPQGALDQAYRYYWSGLVPYVVLPKFKWTAGTYTNSVGWKELEKLSTNLTESDLKSISNSFCAILFDKNFSQYQIDRKAGLRSTQGLWPGLRIENTETPHFEDSRYAIYKLN